MLKKNIIADLRLLKERPLLILYLFFPALFAIILKLFFPLIVSPLESLFRLAPENWLTLAIITLISSIPIITGLLLSYMNTYARSLPKDTLFIRSEMIRSMALPFLLTLFIILISIAITNPVPSEGWLRILTVSILLSLFSPYFYMVFTNRYLKNLNSVFLLCFCVYWILAVPAGLLLSSPWHYFAFLSPLYWISWSWLTSSRTESIFLVSLFLLLITSNIIITLKTKYRKKSV